MGSQCVVVDSGCAQIGVEVGYFRLCEKARRVIGVRGWMQSVKVLYTERTSSRAHQ